MQKKFSSLIMIICMVLSAAGGFGSSVSAADEEDYGYSLIDQEIVIHAYFGEAADLIIPAQLDGFPVTAIDDEAFSDCGSLISVIIPNGVTSIGSSAFSHCTALKQVTVPESVTHIGNGAFNSCLPELRLAGPKDSYVQIYAVENSIEFIVLPENFTITASAGIGGKIDPPGESTVEEGQSRTFTIQSDTGYTIDNVKVDGGTVSLKNGTYTFENITEEHTITAAFKLKTYTVMLMEEDKVIKSVKVRYNDTFTRPPIPVKKGYIFVNWYTAKAGGRVFDFERKITENINIYARYKEITARLSRSKINVRVKRAITLKINTNANIASVSWTSSKRACAKVASGKVTGIKTGTSIIRAKVRFADGTVKILKCSVTVIKQMIRFDGNSII